MKNTELNLHPEIISEIECIKQKYEQIMCFVEKKDLEAKKDLIEYSNSLDFDDYKWFRDAISDMWRCCFWKKKFAFYELSAALMNERPRLFA